MPIHCAAMQGRVDAIQTLLFFDTEGKIKMALDSEAQVSLLKLTALMIIVSLISCYVDASRSRQFGVKNVWAFIIQ